MILVSFTDSGRTVPIPLPRKLKGGKVVVPDPLPEPDEYLCLVHARFRKKKISTVVSIFRPTRSETKWKVYCRYHLVRRTQ